MVDIREFFGKGHETGRPDSKSSNVDTKRENARPTVRNNSALNPIEINDLDDDTSCNSNMAKNEQTGEGELLGTQSPTQASTKRVSTMETSSKAQQQAIPSVKQKKESPKRPSKSKKTSVNEVISADGILSQIASVDLSAVHVKENVTFDFRGKSQADNDAEAAADEADFPEGKPNCLLGLTIVFTGLLPNLERGAAEAIAKRYGARVTKSISSKTSVVVLGDEAGPKKLEKIKQLGIKAIDEEGFRQLITGMPAEGGAGTAAEKARQKLKDQEDQAQRDAAEMVRKEAEELKKLDASKAEGADANEIDRLREEHKLWTVKYAPTNLQQICGNKSSVNKLKNWLSNWSSYQKQGFKQPGRDGLGVYRAAMLYGPPGIGKTTAAHLVAKELGYDVLEQNASDVRSKSLLNAGVKNALDNTSVVGFFKQRVDRTANGQNFVIVMDEVDGMSGGDRGGVGQLAQFCRKTSMPMILICNERNLPKMRPFDRVCLDIQFRRPDANSLKARLMTIAVREKFKLDPNVVEKLVQSTRGDIRQIINLLSTITTTTKQIGHDNAYDIALSWEKNVALKPFDIAHKLFEGRNYTESGAKSFPLYKKMELYFDDFDFAPLMVQENYLNTKPAVLKPGQTHLQAVAEAADSISEGDLVERKIRSSEQLWSLLPFHAIMSSVRPASRVAGQMAGRINFTSWLGQNSKMGKYYRILQELQYHTRLSTSTDKLGFRMDYMPTLKRRLLDPLVKEGADGIAEVIRVMDQYYLSKDDWDSIMEFMIGPDKTDIILKKIPTAVKSGFTRKYNAAMHPVSIYKTGSTTAVEGKGPSSTPDFEDIVDADDDVPPADDENDSKDDAIDFKKDKLIKQGKPKAKKRTAGATKKGPAKKERHEIH